ncbi:MAG: hypothetical protein WAL63_16260 [Solirubrobacteraceae bacterium]
MDEPTYDEDDARLITRLVDGSLTDDDRAAAEALRAKRPGVSSEVASEQHVVAELRRAGPPVPDRLVTAVTRRVQTRYGPARAGRARGLRRWQTAIAAPAAALALVLVVVLLLVGGGSAGLRPSIVKAAQLAYAPATHPAPPVRDGRFLDVSYGGVTFPNYERPFGVVPSGQRFDRLGGRPALTVFYRLKSGTRLSYTVFSGRAVPRPSEARAVIYDGVRLHVFVTGSRLAVVTLVRFGRTCVLAAPTPKDLVLALAAEPIRIQA